MTENAVLILKNLKEGKILEAYHDDSPESPRNWSNLGMMLTWQRNKMSPDENKYENVRDFFSDLVGEISEERVYSSCDSNKEYFDAIEALMDRKGFVVCPVYCLDHGSVSYDTSPYRCPWDSGMVGIIYASKESICEEYGVKRVTTKIKEKVCKLFRNECEVYTQWVNGEVYGFKLKNIQGETLDSCWGYYNDLSNKCQLLEAAGYVDNDEEWEKIESIEFIYI